MHSVGIGQRGDSDRAGTASATVVLSYDRRHRRIVQGRPTIYTERASFVNLVKAVNARDRKKALKYASPSTVNSLWESHAYYPQTVKAMECVGITDLWERAQSFSVPVNLGQRACRTVFTYRSSTGRMKTMEPYVVMGHANAGWTSFKGLNQIWVFRTA